MNIGRALVFAFSVTSGIASAAIVDLSCVSVDKDQVPMDIRVDTSQQSVRFNRQTAHGVRITSRAIVFRTGRAPAEFTHVIDRTTGQLAVSTADGSVILRFACEAMRQKF